MKNRCKYCLLLFLFTCSVFAGESPEWCKNIPRPQFTRLEAIPVPSNWFQVYRVKPDTFAISESRQYEEVISYLIVGTKRALLWDTGMGIARIRPIVERLTFLPVIVLNSHTHPDHIGGNYEFENILAMDTDFTRQNSKGYNDPEMKSWVDENHICGSLPEDFNPAQYATKPFTISRFVKDGEVIDLGNRKLRVLRTPGHTPDAICLLDLSNRVMLTGDTFYPGPIYLYSPETDFNAYVRSIDLLVSHRKAIDQLLTAHNEPLAAASSLQKLKRALSDLQSGKVKAVEKDGLREFFFDGFSILMK